MLNPLIRFYRGPVGLQYVNRPLDTWGELLTSRLYVRQSLISLKSTFLLWNTHTLWKYGYNFLGYRKGNYRWRRSLPHYYWNNG